LLDSQGDVVWEAVYETFGKARIDIGLVENHLRFAGQYFIESLFSNNSIDSVVHSHFRRNDK